VEIVSDGPIYGGPQHQSEDLGLDAGVMPFGSRRRDAGIERRDTGCGVLPGLAEVVPELRGIVVLVADLYA